MSDRREGCLLGGMPRLDQPSVVCDRLGCRRRSRSGLMPPVQGRDRMSGWTARGVEAREKRQVAPAERWRELNGLFDAEIREVRGDKPFRWQPSRGTVRGIILADRLFEICPDHKFEPRPNRAFLAPAMPETIAATP